MRTLLLLTFVAATAETVGAQAPTPPGPATPPVQAAASPAREAAPVPAANYAYDATDRRDPFVNLINRGADPRQSAGKGARPEGIAGVMVDEVALRGIVQSQGAFVAMISAPNGRTYTVRQGDRLMDGAVRAINGQSVVMMQEVNDPLSLKKQREVRKQLRGEVK
jgi:Tfp pilus assembly protein PilP